MTNSDSSDTQYNTHKSMHIHNHLCKHSNRARDTTLIQPLHDAKQKLFAASESSGITML